MSSAAVIGRQLRQQNTGLRTSGPLVPPAQQYKGRPRTPSHAVPGNRPYSPAGSGSGTSGPGPGHVRHYVSPAERERQKQCAKQEEPKLKCTWHCFCIALKALSGGIVLLVAGTIMSVVGFVAEANMNSTMLANGTAAGAVAGVAANSTSDSVSTFRNLTYAGKLITRTSRRSDANHVRRPQGP